MSDDLLQKKILLVDDDSLFLDIYSLKFENQGVKTDTAKSGKEALDKMREGCRYDLIIMDILMPKMDGLKTIENMKREKLCQEAKILMLTNQDEPEDVKKAKHFGVENYIVKATMIPTEVVSKAFEILSEKQKV